MRICISVALTLLASVTSFSQVPAEKNINPLKVAMVGAFSNSAQAKSDRNFPEAVLHIAELWPARTDGVWLYAEQSVPRALAHPYKQTIFQLTARSDGIIECRFYDPVDPILFTGAWQNGTDKTALSPADLRFRENCTVLLSLQADGSYKGITEGRGCVSAIRGASYATTEIIAFPSQLVMWERGYNAAGAQVWGSVHGGMVFVKQAE